MFGFSLLCSILFGLTGLRDTHPYLALAFKALVLMAFSEELMKCLPARKIIRRNHATVSFLDVIAYTVISACGFHLMESVVYLFTTTPMQILVRGITNMHAAFGLIQGFLLAKGYQKDRKAPAVLAIACATVVHGLYDFGLDELVVDSLWGDLSLLIAAICLILVIVAFFRIRKARKDPRYTGPLFPEEKGKNPEELS